MKEQINFLVEMPSNPTPTSDTYLEFLKIIFTDKADATLKTIHRWKYVGIIAGNLRVQEHLSTIAVIVPLEDAHDYVRAWYPEKNDLFRAKATTDAEDNEATELLIQSLKEVNESARKVRESVTSTKPDGATPSASKKNNPLYEFSRSAGFERPVVATYVCEHKGSYLSYDSYSDCYERFPYMRLHQSYKEKMQSLVNDYNNGSINEFTLAQKIITLEEELRKSAMVANVYEGGQHDN